MEPREDAEETESAIESNLATSSIYQMPEENALGSPVDDPSISESKAETSGLFSKLESEEEVPAIPNRGTLTMWAGLLGGKSKEEILKLMGRPDRTYKTGAVFCYYRKLRNSNTSNLSLRFNTDSKVVDTVGQDLFSLKPFIEYSTE